MKEPDAQAARPPPASKRRCSLRPWCERTGCAAPSGVSLPHREKPLWFADTLQLVLTAVVERYACRSAGQTPHGVRHQDLARRGGARYPRGDVDGAAVDVV